MKGKEKEGRGKKGDIKAQRPFFLREVDLMETQHGNDDVFDVSERKRESERVKTN